MKLQNPRETSVEVKSVSVKKQYKGIRSLGRLVSIKHDDLDVASGSQGLWIAGLCTQGERTRERVTLNSLPVLSQDNLGAGEQGKEKAWLLVRQVQNSDISADVILSKISIHECPSPQQNAPGSVHAGDFTEPHPQTLAKKSGIAVERESWAESVGCWWMVLSIKGWRGGLGQLGKEHPVCPSVPPKVWLKCWAAGRAGACQESVSKPHSGIYVWGVSTILLLFQRAAFAKKNHL